MKRDAYDRLTSAQRDQLLQNVARMEKAGKSLEQCATIRQYVREDNERAAEGIRRLAAYARAAYEEAAIKELARQQAHRRALDESVH